jgi:hypothetical protein
MRAAAAVDVWSLGVVAWELLGKRHAFPPRLTEAEVRVACNACGLLRHAYGVFRALGEVLGSRRSASRCSGKDCCLRSRVHTVLAEQAVVDRQTCSACERSHALARCGRLTQSCHAGLGPAGWPDAAAMGGRRTRGWRRRAAPGHARVLVHAAVPVARPSRAAERSRVRDRAPRHSGHRWRDESNIRPPGGCGRREDCSESHVCAQAGLSCGSTSPVGRCVVGCTLDKQHELR